MPTVTQLLAEIRGNLDEPVEAQFSNTNLRTWINEAMRDLSRETRQLQSTATVSLTANVSEYTLAADILSVELAWYDDTNGRVLPLTPRHYEGMDQVWGQWQNTRFGEPTYYTIWGYSPAMKIKLYPTPTISSHVLRMNTTKLATAIALDGSGDGGSIDFPTAWYDAINDYVEYRAKRKDRDPDWQNAYQKYVATRDDLKMESALPVNREIVADPVRGYLPRWLTDFDG